MACNCGRGQKRPAGMTGRPGTGGNPSVASTRGEDKKANRTQTFTLTTLDGKRQTFGSRLEANAERVRAGGGSISAN